MNRIKSGLKTVVLSYRTWLIASAFTVSNLFFENWYGGNFEIDNTWYEYGIATFTGLMFFATAIFPNKMVKFFEKTFKF